MLPSKLKNQNNCWSLLCTNGWWNIIVYLLLIFFDIRAWNRWWKKMSLGMSLDVSWSIKLRNSLYWHQLQHCYCLRMHRNYDCVKNVSDSKLIVYMYDEKCLNEKSAVRLRLSMIQFLYCKMIIELGFTCWPQPFFFIVIWNWTIVVISMMINLELSCVLTLTLHHIKKILII